MARAKSEELKSKSQKLVAASPLLKSHVDQQLFALDVNNVAEGAVAAAGGVEVNAALADAQVTDVEMVEERGQRRADSVAVLSVRAWTGAKYRREHKKNSAGSPAL